MERKKYLLKTEEIETLIKGLIENGTKDTYERMKEKALISMEKLKELDEMFLDMAENVLERARLEINENEEAKQLRDIYYLLHSMFRNLAHEVNKIYRQKGKENTGERFIRLVSHNKEAPATFHIKGN